MYGHGPDEDDVVEHGAAPVRLPGWVRRPRWLPALGRRPSRGAALLAIAGPGVGPTAAANVPPVVAGPIAPPGLAASADGPGAYSSSLSIAGPSELAQTGGTCSVQRGPDLPARGDVVHL